MFLYLGTSNICTIPTNMIRKRKSWVPLKNYFGLRLSEVPKRVFIYISSSIIILFPFHRMYRITLLNTYSEYISEYTNSNPKKGVWKYQKRPINNSFLLKKKNGKQIFADSVCDPQCNAPVYTYILETHATVQSFEKQKKKKCKLKLKHMYMINT